MVKRKSLESSDVVDRNVEQLAPGQVYLSGYVRWSVKLADGFLASDLPQCSHAYEHMSVRAQYFAMPPRQSLAAVKCPDESMCVDKIGGHLMYSSHSGPSSSK